LAFFQQRFEYRSAFFKFLFSPFAISVFFFRYAFHEMFYMSKKFRIRNASNV